MKNRKILFVYKNYTYDPCLQAMKRWLRKLNDKSHYFEFKDYERVRGKNLTSKRLLKNLKDYNYDILIMWNPLLTLEEILLVKKKK